MKSIKTIWEIVDPNTFLIPISLVFSSAEKADKPNGPKHPVKIASAANGKDISNLFFGKIHVVKSFIQERIIEGCPGASSFHLLSQF